MRVLLATADPVRLSFVMSLLRDAGCSPTVLDAAISAVEGGIGAFPRRVAVPDDQADRAIRALHDAGEVEGPC